MEKVPATGGGLFIGSHLIDALMTPGANASISTSPAEPCEILTMLLKPRNKNGLNQSNIHFQQNPRAVELYVLFPTFITVARAVTVFSSPPIGP